MFLPFEVYLPKSTSKMLKWKVFVSWDKTTVQIREKYFLQTNDSLDCVLKRFRSKDVACLVSVFLNVCQKGVAVSVHEDKVPNQPRSLSFRFSHFLSANYSFYTPMWPYFYFLSIKIYSKNMQISDKAMNTSLIFNSLHTNNLSKYEHPQKRRDPNVFQISIPLCFRLRMRAVWNCMWFVMT